MVRFKAKLSDGSVVVGPIMGNGGMLCAAVVGTELAKKTALRRIRQAQSRYAEGERDNPGIYDPEPGCVAMYPNYSAEGDGESIAVPLSSTKFSVVE